MRYLILCFNIIILWGCQKKISHNLEISTTKVDTVSAPIWITLYDIYGEAQFTELSTKGTKLHNQPNMLFPQIAKIAIGRFDFIPIFVRNNKLALNIQNNNISYKDSLMSKESNLIKALDINISFLGKTTDPKKWWQEKRNLNNHLQNCMKSYQYQLSFADSVLRLTYYRQDFKNYIFQNLKYSYFSSLIEPFLFGKIDSLDKDYIKKMYSIKDSLLNTVDYKTGKMGGGISFNYNKFLCRNYLNSSQEFIAQWDTAISNFKGDTKDYILFNLLINKKNFHKINNISQYKKLIKQPLLRSYIDSLYREKNRVFKPKEKNEILTDTSNYSKKLAQILTDNKGHVVFLDFWASWCLPCRKEMQLYKNLEPLFKQNNTKVVFLSVDKDKDETAWKRAISKTGTSEYDHYRLKANSIFNSITNLAEIPRYIILNKDGVLVDKDAPRPSNKEQLSELLRIINDQ